MNPMFPSGGGRNGYSAVRPSVEADVDGNNEMEEAFLHRHILLESVLRLSHEDEEAAQPSTGELAGVYLGVLNVYTTLPQFVGTFISWIVFTLLEPSKNDVSNDNLDHHVAGREEERAERNRDLSVCWRLLLCCGRRWPSSVIVKAASL